MNGQQRQFVYLQIKRQWPQKIFPWTNTQHEAQCFPAIYGGIRKFNLPKCINCEVFDRGVSKETCQIIIELLFSFDHSISMFNHAYSYPTWRDLWVCLISFCASVEAKKMMPWCYFGSCIMSNQSTLLFQIHI